jgi:hypothetical protein
MSTPRSVCIFIQLKDKQKPRFTIGATGVDIVTRLGVYAQTNTGPDFFRALVDFRFSAMRCITRSCIKIVFLHLLGSARKCQ